MTDFAVAVEISAPPDRVWAVMSDIEAWPEWTPTVTRVELLDPGPLAVGQRARVLQPRLPAALWRITALEPGRSFTWVTRSPGVVVTARHSVEPAEGGSADHPGAQHPVSGPRGGGPAAAERGALTSDDRHLSLPRVRDDGP